MRSSSETSWLWVGWQVKQMFNELYGTYYRMMHLILERAARQPVSIQDIFDVVERDGFAESGLYFTPDAISQDGSGYSLLRKTPEGYASILKNAPLWRLTLEQKRLVKTMLQDPRIRLFLSDADLSALSSKLPGVAPLYSADDIMLTETAADGDDYGDEAYQVRFKMLLGAVKQRSLLRIVYNSSRGQRKTVSVAPYKLEYSVRDDKFRLCGVSLSDVRPVRYVKLNVARITAITLEGGAPDINFERFIERKTLKEPIVIEVSDFRNGFERIFIGLSNYRRISSLDEETGNCTMKIFCIDDDVPDLLILILSFGPAVRVIGPPDFKARVEERIKRQIDMLKAGE